MMVRKMVLGCALVGVATAAMPFHSLAKGPAWISIETPVNPYDAATRGAYLVVHAYHHNAAMAYPVTGTAEGLVNGERRSIALEFTPTSQAGSYALRKMWPTAGIWTLVIAAHQTPVYQAQAIVDIGSDGDVAHVRVPTQIGERDMPCLRPSARVILTNH